jgi:hypothetical protein
MSRNVGKFAEVNRDNAPKNMGIYAMDRLGLTHVIALFEGKWLRFDNYDLAKKVVSPLQHHMIFTTIAEMQEKLGAKKMMELGRKFGCKSSLELWGKLHMNAYDPLVKYVDLKEAIKKGTAGKVKRYKKKVAYKFIFDGSNEACAKMYGRLPPQACAVIDIFVKATANKGVNHFTEVEMQGIIELNKEDLNTKQDPWRIFQYYRGRLITLGILRFHHE